ncbi:hypothetical protein GOBAR_AA27364 [Gossypium barbadense]|uniref:Uncharacterized protein n=1 Tax=Gossypium barbadense TaxID=3634 RepID=A0A2P5WQD7_GOSBA|nr:hypothetical protein GOBAR_AA27364 [Gossypium barbadense]
MGVCGRPSIKPYTVVEANLNQLLVLAFLFLIPCLPWQGSLASKLYLRPIRLHVNYQDDGVCQLQVPTFVS